MRCIFSLFIKFPKNEANIGINDVRIISKFTGINVETSILITITAKLLIDLITTNLN